MTRFRWSLSLALAGSAAACHPDAVTNSPIVASAGINFANAVPDTNKMIFRVVDIPANAVLAGATFRSANNYPIGITAGTRRIRVFFDTTDVMLAQTVLIDTTYTFVQDQHYSFLAAGFARAGKTPGIGALITPIVAPAVGAGKFAIRVVNLAPSFAGAVPTLADTTVHADAFVRKIDSLPSGTAEATDLGYRATSAYTVLDTGFYRVALTATGTTSPPIVQMTLPLGVRGTASVNPIGGTLVAGTIMTAVIVSRSVVASKAPQGGSPSSKKVEVVTRSNDTVTVQSGTITFRANRPDTVVTDTIIAGNPPDTTIRKDTLRMRPDSIVDSTGTHASTGVNRGDIVYVSGANEAAYNGWQAVIRVPDSLSCNPVNAGDTVTKCKTTNALAKTFFRLRYRITGAPTSPATGTVVYTIYPPTTVPGDYTIPFVVYVVDQRPPNTAP